MSCKFYRGTTFRENQSRNQIPFFDTFEALNEKTTNERESFTSQLSESNQVRSELQLHITQLEHQNKMVKYTRPNPFRV